MAWLLRAPEPLLFQGSEAARTSSVPFHHHRPAIPSRPATIVPPPTTSPAQVALAGRYAAAYRDAEQDVESALGVIHFSGLFPRSVSPRTGCGQPGVPWPRREIFCGSSATVRIQDGQTYADTAAVLTRTGTWPSGQKGAWLGRIVLRESFETGQRTDGLLAAADSLLALLSEGNHTVSEVAILFGDPAAARTYAGARTTLLRRIAAERNDATPYSLRILAAGFSQPLPPPARP